MKIGKSQNWFLKNPLMQHFRTQNELQHPNSMTENVIVLEIMLCFKQNSGNFNYLVRLDRRDTKRRKYLSFCGTWRDKRAVPSETQALTCCRVCRFMRWQKGGRISCPPSFTTPTQPHINYISCHCQRIDFSIPHLFSLFLGTQCHNIFLLSVKEQGIWHSHLTHYYSIKFTACGVEKWHCTLLTWGMRYVVDRCEY